MNSNDEDEAKSMSEQRIENLLKEVGKRPEPPADMAEQVRANVKLAWQEEVQKASRARQRNQWFAIAASVFVAVGAIFFTLQDGAPAPTVASLVQVVGQPEYRVPDGEWQLLGSELSDLESGAEIRTGQNAYASISLANGMHLRIKEQTNLMLLGNNEIELKTGAIYAESDGSEDSVRVVTPFGVAQDIGTEFEVLVNSDAWRVQVREGKVSMQDNEQTLFADAGQRIVIAADNSVRQETVEKTDPSWGWTHNVKEPFQLEGATLAGYLNWWSSETGKSTSFQTEADATTASELVLHGSLDGLSLDAGLTAVLASSGFHVVDSTENQVIFAR